MSKVILVPIDGSKKSYAVLEEAIRVAKTYGDELRVLNVQPTLKELGLIAIQEATTLVEQHGVPFTTKIRIGIAAIEIITEANDPMVRYVIMAIGKGKTEDIGSVSRRVLELASCPVILFP